MNYYNIFRECFPDISITDEMFIQLSGIEQSTVFTHNISGETVGFVMVNDNCIRLLCVAERYRNQGIGKKLMNMAEEHIKSKGYNEIILGGFSAGLFIGVPVSKDDWDRHSSPYFEKLGYSASNGCAEMEMNITAFCADRYHLPVPENAEFDWYKGSPEELTAAVSAVDEEWVQYFTDCDVFCGFIDGEIASFCIVGNNEPCIISDGMGKVGAVGCVGTVPKFRRKGIGLKMVALATEELKKQGYKKCFIHFTGVFDWYAKLGYKTVLWEWFGRKKLD